MIHEVLRLERPLMVFDFETTGVNTQTARAIELAFQRFTSVGLDKEWSTYINPEIDIPEDSTAIHGISNALVTVLCRKCKVHRDEHPTESCDTFHPVPRFKDLAENLAIGFSNCDFAGKNIRFDLEIMAHEMQLAGVKWSYGGARVIDAERLEQIGVPRSLSHLYEKYTGEKLEGAHGAMVDVRASTVVITAQLRRFPELFPRDLDQLHEVQWPGRIDPQGKFRVKNGGVVCTFGAHRDKRIQEIPPSYWRWLLKQNFPQEIQDIANDALKGVYPKVKNDGHNQNSEEK